MEFPRGANGGDSVLREEGDAGKEKACGLLDFDPTAWSDEAAWMARMPSDFNRAVGEG